MTIEDESAIANIIVWPNTFERFRPIILGARYVAISGRVQQESGVIHVVADKLDDLTFLLARLAEGPADRKPRARRRGQAAARRAPSTAAAAAAAASAAAGAVARRCRSSPAISTYRRAAPRMPQRGVAAAELLLSWLALRPR